MNGTLTKFDVITRIQFERGALRGAIALLLRLEDPPNEEQLAVLRDAGCRIVATLGRVIEVTIARTDTTEIERGYTGQRGQDEQNRRARKAAVQTPGKALTRTELSL